HDASLSSQTPTGARATPRGEETKGYLVRMCKTSRILSKFAVENAKAVRTDALARSFTCPVSFHLPLSE
ncbi:MAG: hypothetical protein PUK17_00750, partial [Bacteroidales bacterium]|nr:hypothetical protein [Bacteroidales bacterium]